MKPDNLVVYTAFFEDYDVLMDPKNPYDNINYVCFTDSGIASDVWEERRLEEGLEDMSPADKNRYVKMHPQEFFPEYEYSLYIDANIYIKGNLAEFLNEFGDSDFLAPDHYWNNCAYEEAEELKNSEKGNNLLISQQIKKYREEGFPEDYGHTENNVLLRRHSSPEIKNLMEAWWEEYKSESNRDQLSLSYLTWKLDIERSREKFGPRYSSKYFDMHPHKPNGFMGLTWEYWTPLHYKKDENFGYYLLYLPITSTKIIYEEGLSGFVSSFRRKIKEVLPK